MEVMAAIEKRRSVRKYKDAVIPQEYLDQLAKAIYLAPSGANRQAYHFYFVMDAAMRAQVCEKAIPQPFVANAPLIVVATCDEGRRFDVGIAVQNFVVAATGLGLGTCYIGRYEKEEMRAVLNIPQDQELAIVCVAGFADEEPAFRARKTADELITKI